MKSFGYKSVTLTPAELRLIRSLLTTEARYADADKKWAEEQTMDAGYAQRSARRAAACRELKKRLKVQK